MIDSIESGRATRTTEGGVLSGFEVCAFVSDARVAMETRANAARFQDAILAALAAEIGRQLGIPLSKAILRALAEQGQDLPKSPRSAAEKE